MFLETIHDLLKLKDTKISALCKYGAPPIGHAQNSGLGIDTENDSLSPLFHTRFVTSVLIRKIKRLDFLLWRICLTIK